MKPGFTNTRMRLTATAGAILVLALYIILLLAKGYPMPHGDDLIFLGTPINAIQSGVFANPYCANFLQQFGTIEHLYYLPGHAWLLFFWLKLTGISTFSLLVFQWIGYGVGMAGLYLLLVNRFALQPARALLLCGIYLTLVLQMGLRPEAWGFGLMFLGLALFNPATYGGLFTGILLIGAGTLCSPLSIGISTSLVVYLYFSHKQRLHWLKLIAAGLLAVILIFLLLGLMIAFRYEQFIRIIVDHAAISREGMTTFQQFSVLLIEGYNRFLKLPLYAIAVIFAIIAAVSGKEQKKGIAISLLICMLISIIVYPEKTAYFSGIILCWFMLVMLPLPAGRERLRNYLSLGIAGLFFYTQSYFFIALMGQKNHMDRKEQATFMREASKYKYVVGDVTLARTIYDYRLPDNYKSLEFYTYKFLPESIQQCKAGEIWIFHLELPVIRPEEGFKEDKKVSIGNKKFNSIPRNNFSLRWTSRDEDNRVGNKYHYRFPQ